MKKIFYFCLFFVVSLHAQISLEFVEHGKIENTTWDCIKYGIHNVYAASTSSEEMGRIISILRTQPRNVIIARDNGRYVGHMFYIVVDNQHVRMGMVGASDMSNMPAFLGLANQMLDTLESQFSRTVICGCMSSQREKLLPLLSAARFHEDPSIEQDPAEFKRDYDLDITKDYHWFVRKN